jgi:SAM-dependent methyltransferase
VRDVQLLLSEIRRVLRPGGTLALTTPANFPVGRRPDPLSPHLRFLSRRSLRGLLDQLGFEVRSLRRRSGTLFARATR